MVSVPRKINYVQYICIASSRSKRHIKALAEFVRKVYKKKCYKSDAIPRIEGKNSDEWIALDLGKLILFNIIYSLLENTFVSFEILNN